MTELECEYCENVFSTKQNLKIHQSTAKYCLDKQNQVDTPNIKCTDCLKTFTTQFSLERHKNKCNIKNIIDPYRIKISERDKEIQKYKEENQKLSASLFEKIEEIYKKDIQIKDLQDKIENIALKAVSRQTTVNTNTTNVNTYIQQMDIVTDQIFQDNLENFNIEYIKKGAEGFANYALEHPLHNRIACVDYSRKKVKYKDENGNVVSDPDMIKLSTKLFSSILVKNKELIKQYVNEVTYSTLNPDEKMQIMVDMTDYMFLVNRGADGEKHELYDNFLKNICLKTLVK